MPRHEFDPIHYTILANRLRAIQKRWNKKAAAAAGRGNTDAASRLRELSPCGQLVRLIRRSVEVEDDGRYAAMGAVIRDYANYNLSFAPMKDTLNYNNAVLIERRVASILTEARRGNGRGFQEALIRYLWEHKRWRPEPAMIRHLTKTLSPAIQPFFSPIADDTRPQAASRSPTAAITDSNSASWNRALKLLAKEAKERTGSLNLSQLDIEKIPDEVSEFHWLRHLDCSFTPISSLSELESCTKLISLDIGWSSIPSLTELRFTPYLTSLILHNTRISSLDGIEHSQYLRTIDCSETDITSLSGLSLCGSISKVIVSDTKVTSLAELSSCFSLKELSICRSRISDYSDLAECHRLETLNCSLANLGALDKLRAARQVKHLICRESQITQCAGIELFYDLETLLLENNPLSNLEDIGKCSGLKLLGLSGTEVDDISQLFGCKNLEILTLNDTPIRSVSGLDRFNSLEQLHLPSGIEDLSPLRHLTSLRRITLDCHITLSDSDWLWYLPNLEFVECRAGKIEGVPAEVNQGDGSNALHRVKDYLSQARK